MHYIRLAITFLDQNHFCYVADDVDTRAITRRLRQDGSLIGVLSTEDSKTDEELLEISRSWDIVGKNYLLYLKGIINIVKERKHLIFIFNICRC